MKPALFLYLAAAASAVTAHGHGPIGLNNLAKRDSHAAKKAQADPKKAAATSKAKAASASSSAPAAAAASASGSSAAGAAAGAASALPSGVSAGGATLQDGNLIPYPLSPMSVTAFALPATTPTLSGYPPMDTPPPVSQPWMRQIDMSKIPNIPVRKTVDDCPTTGGDPNCAWSCTGCTRDTDVTVCPKPNTWGITYDDGPTGSATSRLLGQALIPLSQRATMFHIGSRIFEFPAVAQAEIAAGMQPCVHTWSHWPLTTQTNEEIIAEILWTEKVMKETYGLVSKYMRPPYGDIDDRVRAILAELGYKPVIWNLDTNDYTIQSDKTFKVEFIEGNFTEWSKQYANGPSGIITLEHDLYVPIVANATEYITTMKQANWEPQPIWQCLGDAVPFQESLSDPTAVANWITAAGSPGSASKSSTSLSGNSTGLGSTNGSVAGTNSTSGTGSSANTSSGSFLSTSFSTAAALGLVALFFARL